MSCFIALAPEICAAQQAEELSPKLDTSVARGLSYLAKQQNPDGSFDGGGPRVAMTGLALMSFLAAGHVPEVGQYGLHVRSAVDFLLKQSPPDGYYGKIDGSRRYGQGIVTLALAKAYGVETEAYRTKIHDELAKAVNVILTAQDLKKEDAHAGGWRYEPTSLNSDLSLSGWNALALRASQNVGMAVPKERVQRAVDYVLKCYRADQKAFRYQPGRDASVGLTGVGILNLYLLDAVDRPEAKDAAAYLTGNPVTPDSGYQYYYLYYTTQAAFQAGEPTWSTVWKVSFEQLLASQMEDGG